MQRFLQLLRESEKQNVFQVLYDLYLTINKSNADEIIAFWHTLMTFKMDMKHEDHLKKISRFQYAIVQRMKQLAYERDPKVIIKTFEGPEQLSLRTRFEHAIGMKLEHWR